jgi:hypothetical protein
MGIPTMSSPGGTVLRIIARAQELTGLCAVGAAVAVLLGLR